MPPMRNGTRYVAKIKGYPETPYELLPKQKKGRPMKAIFKNIRISLAGSFIAPTDSKHPNETTRTPHEKIVGWIEAHAGNFQREVEVDTTHLVCSIEEYKSNSSQVRKAKALGKACKIVVLDWIIDSLLGSPHEKYVKKLKPAKNYMVEDAIKRINKAAQVKDNSKKEFEAGVRASKELADSKLHHVFFDTDGFQYKVELTRVSVSGPVQLEKYTLYLFESHAKPSTYMFGAKYNHNRKPTAYFREHIRPMLFSTAFVEFKKFFKEKTGGIDWDERLEGLVMKDRVFSVEGQEGEQMVFRYTPPKLGQAVGTLPWGYVRPEMRVQAAEEWERELFGDDGEETETGAGTETEETRTLVKGEGGSICSSVLEANVADYSADLVEFKGSY